MSTPHAAWISAAVKAACQSGAPRRTVAAVAAAVTTAILQQTAKATPARTVEEHTGTAAAGLSGDCEALAEQLREARARKRRDKRQRRRDRAQAAANPVPPQAEGDGHSDRAVEEAAMEELPDTTEDPHPKPETDLQSPLSAGNLQARDAQSTPEALVAQGVHFLPEERVVPERRPSLASSAPTDVVEAYYQRWGVADRALTPTGRATRLAPIASPSQPQPSTPKRRRRRARPSGASPKAGPDR